MKSRRELFPVCVYLVFVLTDFIALKTLFFLFYLFGCGDGPQGLMPTSPALETLFWGAKISATS